MLFGTKPFQKIQYNVFLTTFFLFDYIIKYHDITNKLTVYTLHHEYIILHITKSTYNDSL